MALKKKLAKADFDKLSEAIKAEYIADGDGYKLDLSDDEDTGPLKRALEREKEAAGTSKARVKELEAELEALSSNDARKKGDIATLEKSWEKKTQDQAKVYEDRISKLTKHTTNSLVNDVASSVAHKLTKPSSVSLLMPHLKARLVADFDGDMPQTRVLDKDGKPSAMTVEELTAEFVANKDFADIIIGSKASGGAGKITQNNSGAVTQPANADLSKMKPHELAAHLKGSRENTQDE